MDKLNSSAQERNKTLQVGKGKPLDGFLKENFGMQLYEGMKREREK